MTRKSIDEDLKDSTVLSMEQFLCCYCLVGFDFLNRKKRDELKNTLDM